MKKVYEVSQINSYVARMLFAQPVLQNIAIRGEISQPKLYRNNTLYFTLKDEKAQIAGIMFGSNYHSLGFKPQDGDKLVVRGQIKLYEPSGTYQIQAHSFEKEGQGKLNQLYLELKEKLKKKGYFAQKRKLPFLPKKIAVITSLTGAVIHDMISVLDSRFPSYHLQIYPAAVQGARAAGEIARAIDLVNQRGEADLIVLARGGGSIEDLWCFNEEMLAEAIYRSKIVLVTAIGHDTDHTIADLVADQAFATPSVAAEQIMPSLQQLEERQGSLDRRALNIVESKFKLAHLHLKNLSAARVLEDPQYLLEKKKLELEKLEQRLKTWVERATSQRFEALKRLAIKLKGLDPLALLERGYVAVRSSDKKLISSLAELKIGESLYLDFQDGRAEVEVKGKEER